MRSVLVGALAVAGAAILLNHFPAAQAPPPGRPSWEAAEPDDRADPAEADRRRLLEDLDRGVRERTRVKVETAEAVLRGELTLDQAAGAFRDVNAGVAGAYGSLVGLYPGATEEELSCRQVHWFVRGFTARDPAGVAAVLPGLEAELARRFPRPAGG